LFGIHSLIARGAIAAVDAGMPGQSGSQFESFKNAGVVSRLSAA